MTQLLTPDLVALDADLGGTKDDVIARLCGLVRDAGRATDADALATDVRAREGQSATGLPGGLAIPHCRSAAVTTASLAFARLDPKVDFGASDGPADLVFLIAAPAEGDADHLTLLTKLARALVRPDFTAALRSAASPDDVVALVSEVVEEAPAASTVAQESTASAESETGTPVESKTGTPVESHTGTPTITPDDSGAQRTIVAVTACPTGIAHTYMAADSLVQAGERAGAEVIVETQGSSGSTPLDRAVIAGADAVIFATDVGVRDRGRFAGKPVVASGVKRAINDPDAMVAEALAAADDPSAPRVQGETAETAAAGAAGSGRGDVHWGVRLRQVLLTGVSYMIPFVAAGGLLIALGFLIGGYDIVNDGRNMEIITQNSFWDLPAEGLSGYIGAALTALGQLAFSFLVPALAGYIAFAIADRPGIAPGFTVGLVANTVGAGFLGGIVGGLIAGYVALWIAQRSVPDWFRGLMPVVVIPLFATLVSGGLMVFVLGRPLASATTALEDWLNGLTGGSAALLGVVLGLMMAFDLGGPVNKAAYVFATTGLSAVTAGDVEGTTPLTVMAAVMAAGMVPPLACALATAVRPKLFSPAERENGKAAWLLGATFISEGAIPFAAADPLRVIPSMMLGSAVTGAMVMVTGVTLQAPHGGIFVFFAMTKVGLFILALIIGTVISATAMIALKQLAARRAETPVPVAATVG
jgi:fructose PTS system EIIBC or EIIC component